MGYSRQILFFALVQSVSLTFFFSCLQKILLLLLLLLLSFYIFPCFFFSLSSLQTCIFRVTGGVTAKHVLQKRQLIRRHCILFLSSCRLLLLQVMPLSHLHPSHFLLVQTCLALYLSALLPYPQVGNLLEITGSTRMWWSVLSSGLHFSTPGINLVPWERGRILRTVLQGKAKQVFNEQGVRYLEFACIF